MPLGSSPQTAEPPGQALRPGAGPRKRNADGPARAGHPQGDCPQEKLPFIFKPGTDGKNLKRADQVRPEEAQGLQREVRLRAGDRPPEEEVPADMRGPGGQEGRRDQEHRAEQGLRLLPPPLRSHRPA